MIRIRQSSVRENEDKNIFNVFTLSTLRQRKAMHTWLTSPARQNTDQEKDEYAICTVCYILPIKGTVSVISSDPPCKETLFD